MQITEQTPTEMVQNILESATSTHSYKHAIVLGLGDTDILDLLIVNEFTILGIDTQMPKIERPGRIMAMKNQI
ncbi:MAG: hypothetical protein G01um101418_495 [Parcubacteria group bacterium Gr01-1014_18]|nr:MAG: hypothetical protein Greene041636_541 [Parcubacteria group bacterium Greene0416_36]TSC81082.1 MAG: hypothetical protein G01um101418_495 [Parcubacteria group bacterium Gr01-1014_18]TSC98816.1 MAG: hypothetical protein Greene101420_566 [Parcubacteria group bacterium Greene1014_20]TSD06704.1 MAG: hypothetical protein Greene07142_625 [Parcubacteria group bacterium Greene0714_2]